MPRDIKLLRVLIASPQDLAQERQLIPRALNEMNRSELSEMPFRFEALTWESHGAPDFGECPQDVLNQQLSDFDIYLGLLGHRFGTPTKRAFSGTEEEFRRAYQKWKADQRACKLMFYFSEAPVSPSEVDPLQLARVLAFRQELGELGGLYWTYRGITELPDLVRAHLMQAIRSYGKTWGSKIETLIEHSNEQSDTPSFDPLGDVGEDDSAGLLDLAADAESAMEQVNASSQILASALHEWSEKLAKNTKAIEDLQTSGQMSATRARIIVRQAASDTDNMASSVDRELPIFRENWRAVRQAILTILGDPRIFSGQDLKGLRELRDTIIDFRKVMQHNIELGTTLVSVLDNVPRLNKEFIRATRRAKSSVSTLHTEFKQLDVDLSVLADAIEKRMGETEYNA